MMNKEYKESVTLCFLVKVLFTAVKVKTEAVIASKDTILEFFGNYKDPIYMDIVLKMLHEF